jgi:hypothetical protein
LSIIYGPGFSQRLPIFEEGDPECEADGTNGLEPDRDIEEETEEEDQHKDEEPRKRGSVQSLSRNKIETCIT